MAPGTRSSSRLSATQQSSPTSPTSAPSSNGKKRKATEASPGQGGQGKKSGVDEGKKQKTIEETLPGAGADAEKEEKSEAKEVGKEGNGVTDEGVKDQDMKDVVEEVENGSKNDEDGEGDKGGKENDDDKDDKKNPTDDDNSEKRLQEKSDDTVAVNLHGKDEKSSGEAADQDQGAPLEKKATNDEKDIMAANPAKDDDGKLTIDSSTVHNNDDAEQNGNGETKQNGNGESKQNGNGESKQNGNGEVGQNGDAKATSNGEAKIEEKGEGKPEPKGNVKAATESAISEPKERSEAMPSNILEKGIIYFFTRARVGVDDPQSVQDIARSYIVLRPLPSGAKLGDGPLEDLKNNRLLAVPKKVLPKSGRDQFLSFVEKAGTTIADLKENFMQGSTYDTQTTGVRHTNAVTPLGEGVYAITTVGRNTHLAYMLTIPSELGPVQKDMGLRSKGSFVASTKNPTQPGPANAQLPQGPEFPQEILDEFRSLRWLPTQPKHLDYANSQVLLIGEGSGDGNGDEGFGKALEADGGKEGKDGENKQTPLEEVEKLEGEDQDRIEGLEGDEAEAVFADLKLSGDEYPKLMTTW